MIQQVCFAVLVASAWYFVASVLSACAFHASAPLVRHWLRRPHRASRILVVRMIPAIGSALCVGGLVVPAFAWLEPVRSVAAGERLGLTGLALAIAGTGLVVVSLLRGVHAVLATRRRMHAVARQAASSASSVRGAMVFVTESETPYVVLDGVVRPRLFVSRSVMRELTAEEFARAVAHELAHHRALDNLKRRLLAFAPDLVGRASTVRALETAWKQAAEIEADAAAAPTDVQAVTLASALVKVARLAGGTPQVDLGCAAFHDGTPVADRIRALCMRESREPAPRRRGRGLLGLAATALVVAVAMKGPAVLVAIHQVTEFLVHLP